MSAEGTICKYLFSMLYMNVGHFTMWYKYCTNVQLYNVHATEYMKSLRNTFVEFARLVNTIKGQTHEIDTFLSPKNSDQYFQYVL